MAIGFTTHSAHTMPLLRLAPLPAARRWLTTLVNRCARPVMPGKPVGIYLPDRVWRRQSALLMSLHELHQDTRR